MFDFFFYLGCRHFMFYRDGNKYRVSLHMHTNVVVSSLIKRYVTHKY